MTEPEYALDAAAPQPAREGRVYGVVAEFQTPAQLLEAARAVRALGYTRLDAYTPFAVHGIDEALGIERSRLGWIALAAGIAGAAAALTLQWWTGAVASPLVVAGKPLFALPPSVPIIFELTVLLAAFGAVLGMLALNGLPRFHHPVFQHSSFERAMDDRFLLAIEADRPDFDCQAAVTALQAAGGRHTEVVAE